MVDCASAKAWMRRPCKPRWHGRSRHRIDYRHIIEWLVRKPGAFESYRYQADLFPTSRFRMAYDALKETAPSRSSKEYLKILKLAAAAGEVQVDEALRELLVPRECRSLRFRGCAPTREGAYT